MNLERPYPNGFRNFQPPICPRRRCPSRTANAAFTWQRKGIYQRKCDGRRVQRYRCLACTRSFSVQTFRVDYRLQKPTLHWALFDAFVSKVTQRQAARNLECTRKTVRHRLLLLSKHARAFHDEVLRRARRNGGLPGDFQLDELETFEHARRLAPVTMPVLIELHTRFVVHAAAAPLPARGNLRPADLIAKAEREARDGVRRSGSRAAVKACFRVLAQALHTRKPSVISTDRKSSYPTILAEVLKRPYTHARHSSTAPRTRANPLFPINHTLAMMRDGLSRLVRRNWAVSKQRRWLDIHAWVWIAYRNYIRGITNKARRTPSAVVLGVVSRAFTKRAFFEWRVIHSA